MMAILALPTSVDQNVITMLFSIVANILPVMLIKSDIVLVWIGLYDELFYQILVHLCARKLAEVTYFFLEWQYLFLHTYYLVKVIKRVVSCSNFRKPMKSCYDFCASCMMHKKFLHSYIPVGVHCQETKRNLTHPFAASIQRSNS